MSARELTRSEIDRAIAAGRLSPAARTMPTADILWQYAGANGLTEAEARAELETAPNGLVADYRDASGRYRIYVYGATMLTDFDGEPWTGLLSRAPELDGGAPDWQWADYLLDEASGFASNFDGPEGYVLIGGSAYREDHTGSVGMDEAREILAALGRGDDDTDPLQDAGNVLTLPGERAIGASEIEPCAPGDPGYPEFLASLVAVCYARGNR